MKEPGKSARDETPGQSKDTNNANRDEFRATNRNVNQRSS